MPFVPGFRPSSSGFHFPNQWASIPLLTIDFAGLKVPIGDAANGLCGGMVYAARDYFEASVPIPSETQSPTSGPLYDFIVRRLFDSFELWAIPTGPAKYLALMSPALPDHETDMSNIGIGPRGRAWIMIRNEWPKIKADIDAGLLSPMALVQTKSLDPFALGDNHQVLAYGYDLIGNDLTIWIYDPNFAEDDTVRIALSLADPQHTTVVTHSRRANPIWCFFRPGYTAAQPPTISGPQGIGDHFYTTDVNERDTADVDHGYEPEGIAGYVLRLQAPEAAALHRLFHPSSGDHFYTSSSAERDFAVSIAGYMYEGTTGFVLTGPAEGAVPLFRLYNRTNGDHFYTASALERDNAVAQHGYANEPPAGYVFTAEAPDRLPLYRLMKVA